MSVPSSSTPVSEVPFLDVLDPAFDFHTPEVVSARERSWYADSPIGLLVLRYAETRDLLRDRRLINDGKRYGACSPNAPSWHTRRRRR